MRTPSPPARRRARATGTGLLLLTAATYALLAAAPAAAQVQAILEREAGGLGGVPVTVPGVAAAEEPSALAVNPAGIGFVGGFALTWHHETNLTPGSRGDAVYAAQSLGPFGLGLGLSWIRPGEGDGPRWRKTTLGLTAGDGHSLSIGVGWSWFSSPDDAIDRAESWDAGMTWRPWRHLSISAAAMNLDLSVGGTRLPVRYDLGLGVRVWGDALTLAADVLGDDQDGFRATHVAAGAGVELSAGLALAFQVQVPVRDELGNDVRALLALSWNGAHLGLSGGASDGDTGWMGAARLSSERYLTPSLVRIVPAVHVERELAPRFVAFVPVGDPDRWGALLERLARLRDDPDVGGVVVRIDDLDVGAGRAEELRAALAAIGARKQVLAYLGGGGMRAYWVATAANTVAAVPGSAHFLNGFATSRYFLRDALARIGVAVDVVKVGAWKSAPEPLTRMESSTEARQATDALLDEVHGRLVADVAAARRLPPNRVRTLLDRGLFTAEDAKEAGLVDEVLWPDEIPAWARSHTKALPTLERYDPPDPRRAQRWGPPTAIEVIRIEGVIAAGKTRDAFGADGIAGAETIGAALRRAAQDDAVRAIVLRVESPGGDGAAGDLIWREVVRARAHKPVVVSMGDVAASAGYLVAAGADAIVAEPSTLTGSIGVFALKPDLSGLLGKLSVHRESYRRGENADLTSLAKPWSEAERAAVQRAVDRFYDDFVEKVAKGRKLTKAEVEAVAGGRVWSGRAALERKLVDRLGSLEDAIALARERAGIDAGEDVEIRRRWGDGSGFDRSLGAAARALAGEPPLARLAALVPELSALALLSEMGPMLALPVEWVLPEEGR